MRIPAALLGLAGLVGLTISTPIGVPLSDNDLHTLENDHLYVVPSPLNLNPTPEVLASFKQYLQDRTDQSAIHTPKGEELFYNAAVDSEFPLKKRSGVDGLWTWQKPQPVIGKYPDGRLMCRIVSMTAGHTQGPCPPVVSQEEVAKLLHQQYCFQHCCREDGTPCGENWHVHEGPEYKGKHTYNNGYDATVED